MRHLSKIVCFILCTLAIRSETWGKKLPPEQMSKAIQLAHQNIEAYAKETGTTLGEYDLQKFRVMRIKNRDCAGHMHEIFFLIFENKVPDEYAISAQFEIRNDIIIRDLGAGGAALDYLIEIWQNQRLLLNGCE